MLLKCHRCRHHHRGVSALEDGPLALRPTTQGLWTCVFISFAWGEGRIKGAVSTKKRAKKVNECKKGTIAIGLIFSSFEKRPPLCQASSSETDAPFLIPSPASRRPSLPGRKIPESVSLPVGRWRRRRTGRRRWGRLLLPLLSSPWSSSSSRRSSHRRFPRRSSQSRALRISSRRFRLLRSPWRTGQQPRPPRRRRGPGGCSLLAFCGWAPKNKKS